MESIDTLILFFLLIGIMQAVFLLIISSKVRVVIGILRKMELTKIKFFDEAQNM
jgi:hypothetical protein